MDCCRQCQGIEEVFNQEAVAKELSAYHRKGPEKTTRMLVDAIKKEEGVAGLTLLDIGGGVGAIQHELLASGLERATDVDASAAYINAARSEAVRQGWDGRVSFFHGDFVDLAAEIPPADIVTLDRVICCYSDMEKLVDLSAGRVRKLYGVVYPRDRWWIRLGLAVMNIFLQLRGNPYRAFVHPARAVEAIIARHGLQRRFYRRTLIWQVALYSR